MADERNNAAATVKIHEGRGQRLGRQAVRPALATTALGAVGAAPLAPRRLQHLEHGHPLARGQRRRVDPQTVAAPLAVLVGPASARQVVSRGLRERRERGLDRSSGPDEWHASLILNIRTGFNFPYLG